MLPQSGVFLCLPKIKPMSDLFDQTIRQLAAAAIPSPRLETSRLWEYAFPDGIQTPEGRQKLQEAVSRRLRCEPLDKILGRRGFYKFEFKVTKDVLSPRPDTEIIVEEALKFLNPGITQKIVDFGTGSGCILLSLLAENKRWLGWGIDQSSAALQIAAANAEALNVCEQVHWLHKSWFDMDFPAALQPEINLAVSNPPYIPHAEIAMLDPDVREYDPLAALDGGVDGFDHYRRLAEVIPPLLAPDGVVMLEAGINQAEEIASIFSSAGLKLQKIVPDLAGIDRCVILKK